ncbi:MAG: VWA domain-containing protein [Planctomycetota bacterium]
MIGFLGSLLSLERLEQPAWLFALPLLLVVFLLRRRRAREQIAWVPLSLRGMHALPRSRRQRMDALPAILEAVAAAALIVALAGPRERVAVPRVREGIEIVLCLDISSSMAATDMAAGADRLGVAKTAMASFIAARPDDRIALLTFARYPDLRCPSTLDHAALLEILDDVERVAEDDDEDATGIGLAVARAAAILESRGTRSRVVVLVTDGEENLARDATAGEISPAEAAAASRRAGVRVHTIVAGTGSRASDGSFLPLDTTLVEKLARDTKGQFFPARDAVAIQAVYEHIDRLEKAAFEEPRFRFDDRWLPFALTASLAWLLARLLRLAAMGGAA